MFVLGFLLGIIFMTVVFDHELVENKAEIINISYRDRGIKVRVEKIWD